MIRVIDLETTGKDPAKDRAEPCEVAWTDLDQNGPGWHVRDTVAILIKPARSIPPTSSAVHHIVDNMVDKAPSWTSVAQELMRDEKHGDIIYAAHNADFEKQFLWENMRWICTWKVALHLAPKAPAHNLQTLRYWLKLEVDQERAKPPHRAGPDSYVTACLLSRMLNKITVEECIAVSSRPVILPYFVKGKHAMQPVETIPSDYLQWVLNKGDFDENMIATCKHHLALRA